MSEDIKFKYHSVFVNMVQKGYTPKGGVEQPLHSCAIVAHECRGCSLAKTLLEL